MKYTDMIEFSCHSPTLCSIPTRFARMCIVAIDNIHTTTPYLLSLVVIVLNNQLHSACREGGNTANQPCIAHVSPWWFIFKVFLLTGARRSAFHENVANQEWDLTPAILVRRTLNGGICRPTRTFRDNLDADTAQPVYDRPQVDGWEMSVCYEGGEE